jgi:23S rRNA pseudouridine955/2504/2580 synthase
VLVLNKQRGDLMHGVNSLEERVREFYQREVHVKTSGVSFRPGPVHRLDRNTSGLVMFGMSTRGAQEASELIAHNQIEKSYLALLSGSLASRQRWTDPIRRDRTAKISRAVAGGSDAQPAESEAIPLISSSRATLALVQIYGGRTHQIRVHASAHGHPLLGDKKYGGQTINGYGYLLHAAKLRLPEGHPVLGFACVWAPLPQAARQLLESYFQHTEVVHAIKSVECHSPRD